MEYAAKVTDVINSSTSTDDITDEYYDTNVRLESKRKALESYYNLLKNANGINEILQIQSEINKLTEEIEALEGILRIWDQLVSESSLTLTINQKNDPLKYKKEVNWSALSWKDVGRIIKNGFISVLNIIVAILQWLIIILASLSPVIIIAGVILLIVRKNYKKKRQSQNILSQPENTENKFENKQN